MALPAPQAPPDRLVGMVTLDPPARLALLALRAFRASPALPAHRVLMVLASASSAASTTLASYHLRAMKSVTLTSSLVTYGCGMGLAGRT